MGASLYACVHSLPITSYNLVSGEFTDAERFLWSVSLVNIYSTNKQEFFSAPSHIEEEEEKGEAEEGRRRRII